MTVQETGRIRCPSKVPGFPAAYRRHGDIKDNKR
jgi:hypothetical protein